MSHRTFPERYEVQRRGIQDPDESCYVVLDVVHDWSARVALQRLVRLYLMSGQPMTAQELTAVLDETQDAARRVIEASQPAPQRTTRRRR